MAVLHGKRSTSTMQGRGQRQAANPRPPASKKPSQLSSESSSSGKSRRAGIGKASDQSPKSHVKAKSQPKPQPEPVRLPLITWEGKTRIEHFHGGRFVRLGEVRGKTLAWVELYAGGPETTSSITLRFLDRTELVLELIPGLTMRTEYFSDRGGDYRLLRKWKVIKTGS